MDAGPKRSRHEMENELDRITSLLQKNQCQVNRVRVHRNDRRNNHRSDGGIFRLLDE